MKILVIFTGGTISCTNKNGFLSPSADAAQSVIEEYRRLYSDDTEFEELSPFTVLSENLCAETLNMLISTAYEKIKQGYDKIIICHGTDTLRFSAAALAFALSGEGAKVVFVSSNYPLDDKRSNGAQNFLRLLNFLKIITKAAFLFHIKTKGITQKFCLLQGFLQAQRETTEFMRQTEILPHR